MSEDIIGIVVGVPTFFGSAIVLTFLVMRFKLKKKE